MKSPNGLPVVYVGREGNNKNGVEKNPYANPFEVGKDGNLATVLYLYSQYLDNKLRVYPNMLAPLRGKNLACWCPLNRPCHADILLRLANIEHVPENIRLIPETKENAPSG